jgi:hypothetical protein
MPGGCFDDECAGDAVLGHTVLTIKKTNVI